MVTILVSFTILESTDGMVYCRKSDTSRDAATTCTEANSNRSVDSYLLDVQIAVDRARITKQVYSTRLASNIVISVIPS